MVELSTKEPETVERVSDEQLIEVLEGRAAFYETLASLYFKPLTQEAIDSMATTNLSVYAEVNEKFADGINDITRYLRKRTTGTRQELALDFTSSFGGTKAYAGKYAVPYKSVFTSEDGLLYQEGYQEVFNAFKHAAVKKREGLDYPDDHISFMCEFLALLERRAISAIKAGAYTGAKDDLAISKQFLETHILSWFDTFVRVAEKLVKTRFYRGVLKITQGFFEFSGESLDDLLEEVER